MASKKGMHPEIRISATKGDAILNKKMREFVISSNSKKFCSNIYSVLVSNEFIQHFHCGFKHDYTNIGKKADMVEAWIYFLYSNYGEKYLEKYLKKQLAIMKFKIDYKIVDLKLKALNN